MNILYVNGFAYMNHKGMLIDTVVAGLINRMTIMQFTSNIYTEL